MEAFIVSLLHLISVFFKFRRAQAPYKACAHPKSPHPTGQRAGGILGLDGHHDARPGPGQHCEPAPVPRGLEEAASPGSGTPLTLMTHTLRSNCRGWSSS